MFDEVAPTSQLYENNEADAQTTRYVANMLNDETSSDVISDKNGEKKKSVVEPEDLKLSDEKQEDLQSLHLTSASSTSASTEKGEEKKEESREIKSLRNIFAGGHPHRPFNPKNKKDNRGHLAGRDDR